jgi:hypothetical protein
LVVYLSAMPRPKPAEPVHRFQVKIPESEAAAVEAIVEAWGAALAAKGIHVVPTPTAWFRGVLREQAERYDVKLAAQSTAGPPSKAPKPKATPKRGSR